MKKTYSYEKTKALITVKKSFGYEKKSKLKQVKTRELGLEELSLARFMEGRKVKIVKIVKN